MADSPQTPPSLEHELRTPLNQIIGFTELLEEDAADLGDEAFTADLKKIHTAATPLRAIVLENFGITRFSVAQSERLDPGRPVNLLQRETTPLPQTLQANPPPQALPVIVLSASDDPERIARCIEMGAEDYLPKPFDPLLLQARIESGLEKKRLRDREAEYLRTIQREKARSDDLLPANIAAELKDTGDVKPRRIDSVAVLFNDVVGFTSYCEKRAPNPRPRSSPLPNDRNSCPLP